MSEQKTGSTDISNFYGNYTIGTSPPYSTIKDEQTWTTVIYGPKNSTLVTISADGEITYGPDYDPDRAADIFWRTVGNRKPNDAKRIAELEAENAKLREALRFYENPTGDVPDFYSELDFGSRARAELGENKP